MRGSATTLLVVLVFWLAGSAWWYTCKIKENCVSFSKNSKSVSSTLIVELEGEESQTFYLKNSSNGVMEFLPGSSGDGLSVIKRFLKENPDQNIDLFTANESQANGLLAMMILSGIPNRRINAYTDPTLGTADKPLKITSSSNSATPLDTTFPADTVTVFEPQGELNQEESINDDVEANVSPAPKPIYTPLVCPTVDLEGGLPSIGDILYPTSSYKVRCEARLRTFAIAAKPWLNDDHNVDLIITGHTDANKTKTNNYQLSLKRAVEVKKYLIKQGIPGHRIETYSKGSDAPIADNGNAEGQQSNRRVEISWVY